MPATPAGYRRVAWTTADFTYLTGLVLASPSGTVTALTQAGSLYLAVFNAHPDDGGTQVTTGLKDADGADVGVLRSDAAGNIKGFVLDTLPEDLWLVLATSGGAVTGTEWYRVGSPVGPRHAAMDTRSANIETAATALTSRVTTAEDDIVTLAGRPSGVSSLLALSDVDGESFTADDMVPTWQAATSQFVAAARGGTGSTTKRDFLIPISFTGTLVVGRAVHDIPNPTGVALTILGVTPTIGTASTGASVIGDIEIGGASIYTSGNRPTIAAAAKTGTRASVIATPSWGSAATLVAWVDQIGSTTPGADLVLIVHARET